MLPTFTVALVSPTVSPLKYKEIVSAVTDSKDGQVRRRFTVSPRCVMSAVSYAVGGDTVMATYVFKQEDREVEGGEPTDVILTAGLRRTNGGGGRESRLTHCLKHPRRLLYAAGRYT